MTLGIGHRIYEAINEEAHGLLYKGVLGLSLGLPEGMKVSSHKRVLD